MKHEAVWSSQVPISKNYTHYSTTRIGFDQHLVDVADLSQKYVKLVIDVHIKEELVYNKHEGCLIGFVNLGETNNRLLEFESTLAEDNSIASTMLVTMVHARTLLSSKLSLCPIWML